MKKKTHRSRKFIYKRCRIVGAPGTLSGYLEQAMAEHSRTVARQQRLTDPRRPPQLGREGEAPITTRFINTFRLWDPTPMRCGNVIEFTPGSLPQGFRFDENATELPVSAIAELDEETHFIEGVLFFGVLGNHVIVMPSGSLHVRDLEEHLNWLLRECCDVLHGGAVALVDELSPETRSQLRGVRALTLRSPLDLSDGNTEEEPKAGPGGMLSSLVQNLVPTLKDVIGELSTARAESLDRLSVTLEVRYRGRASNLDTTLLDHVARMLPDDEAALYEFDVQGVGRVKSGQVRLERKISVAHLQGLPIFNDVAAKMHAWLYQLLEEQRVRE